MKPVYFQFSPNDAVARLCSDLMLSVAPATERVVWPSPGGDPNQLAPFEKSVAFSNDLPDIVRVTFFAGLKKSEATHFSLIGPSLRI